jgi:hypothetical protein
MSPRRVGNSYYEVVAVDPIASQAMTQWGAQRTWRLFADTNRKISIDQQRVSPPAEGDKSNSAKAVDAMCLFD